MKTKTIMFILLGGTLLIPLQHTEAQFLKKLGKKAKEGAERGVERTVERKAEQKAEESTEKAIETVFGVPKSVMDKKEDNEGDGLEGIWYYESLEGVPGYENLNDCGKKSNITYSANSYHVQFYDNDCNLLTDSGGTFELEDNIMKVTAEAKDEMSTTKITTTQTIMEQTQNRLVMKDDMSGAVVTLVREKE
jgi:hypothetical protein